MENKDVNIESQKENVERRNLKPKEKKFIIAIIIIVIIFCVGYSLYRIYLSYEDYEKIDDNYVPFEEGSKKFEEQKNNVKISSQGLDINKSLIVLLENQNADNMCNILLYVIFYDGENKPIMVDKENINYLGSNSKYYVSIDKVPENFERYDFLLMKEDFYYNYNYNSYKNDISFETYKNDNNIVIKGKNNSNEKIDKLSFTVVYYDESGKIIGIQEANEYDIKKNKEFSITAYNLYKKDDYEYVDFSTYEVILNNAYKY